MNSVTKILVVDDTETHRYAVCKYLRPAGYTVFEAASGEECLEMARRHRPDLIILDVNLPDVSGLELCQYIRNDPDLKGTPVMHISATFTLSEHKVKGLENGADAYLTGPVEPGELMANVHVLLRTREAEKKARTASAHLERVLSSITDAYFAIDADGRILDMNRSAETVVFKRSKADLAGKSIWKDLSQSWPAEFSYACRQAIEQQRITNCEAFVSEGNHWFDVLIYPEDGRLEIYLQDNTARKRIEIALLESEVRFRAMAETVPGLIFTADSNGLYDFTNKRFQELAGQRITGEQWIYLLHTDDQTPASCLWNQCVKAGTPFESAYRFRTRKGEYRWHLGRSFPMKDAQDRASKWFGVWIDIDDLKRAQAEIHRLNQGLQQIVEERTAELASTIQELESFSYTISHDMRAPLRAISGFSDLLASDYASVLGDDGKDLLRRMGSAASRLDQLILDVLNFSKINREPIDLHRLELNAVFQSLFESYPQYQSPEIDIRLEGEFLPVMGNESLLGQCISNLIENAIKFAPTGTKPRIRISCTRANAAVKITIEDNGIGIAPEHHERIFGVFERLHAAEAYPGTGIGLSIVRRAVQRMKGRLGVESELGKGSRFWIELVAA